MSEQLDLFGEPEPDPELVALARRIPPHVRFGTSSWTFEGWKGLVYRKRYPSKQAFVQTSLREYARFPLFRTVGIDRSYYAPLTREELAEYAAQLPEGFVCCSKVWSEITTRVFPKHERYGERAGKANPLFLDATAFVEHVAGPLREGFSGHVGPLIVEVPPAPWRSDAEGFARAVERFLGAVPVDLHYAFEIREPALLTDRYLSVLRAHPHASHLFNFHTNMPPIAAQLDRRGMPLAEIAVARLMIPPKKRYADLQKAYAPFDRIVDPQPGLRADVLRLIEATAARGARLFVIANNKAEGSSPRTVEAIVRMLR